MSDCHPNAPETPQKPEKGHCIACGSEKAQEGTTQGKFCSALCEKSWVDGCLSKLSIEDCLELMARVMTSTEEREAQKARKWVKAFTAKA